MIRRSSGGSFKNTIQFFKNGASTSGRFKKIMNSYGPKGVDALKRTIPKDTGLTGDSIFYRVTNTGLYFFSSNIVDGVPVFLLIQYGHATKNGGFVAGRDFVNPALQPIFDKINDEFVKEVNRL